MKLQWCTCAPLRQPDMIVSSENTITLVPNPASDVLKVDLQEKFSSGRTVVNIYNLLGEQVKHVTSENESSIQLDVDQLPPGQYLVKIIHETGDIAVAKLQVQ